ncbi:hypothetical protein CA601_29450 [Paraburkholderia hospita]|nr:hypothetical protein CA601_29450 [Paraburkholderia hospita]
MRISSATTQTRNRTRHDARTTLEMVIDGEAEVVGSNRGAARSAIDHAKSMGLTAATVSATRERALWYCSRCLMATGISRT